MKHYWSIYILALIIATSCSGPKHVALNNTLTSKNRCNQQNLYIYDTSEIPIPYHRLSLDTVLIERFSTNSLNIAHAIGIIDLLKAYSKAERKYKEAPNLENEMSMLRIRQKISNKINIASLEISAVASEVDCEDERADQWGDYLKKKESEKETKLTVGAFVTGGLLALTSVIIFSSDKKSSYIDELGIAAGISEAIFGLLIYTSHPNIQFYHQRNHLREIWEGPNTSTLFPASIWYYFNYNNPSDTSNTSLRDQLKAGWIATDEWNNLKPKKRKLQMEILFQDGGSYDADQLKARSRMLDQLQAYITLMKQDLTKLATEFENSYKD